MSTTTVIVIIVAVVVVLLIVLGTSLVLARRRRISLADKGKDETPKATGYQAGAGISLAPGGADAGLPRPDDTITEPVPIQQEPPTDSLAIQDVLDETTRAEVDEIAPPAGRLERLRGRLARSQSAFGQSLLGILGAGDLDEDSWTDIEDTLLMADLGAATTTEIVATLRAELVARGVRTPDAARALLREVLIDALHPDMDRAVRALPHPDGPAVVLVAGVNGTGKTTTTGKLARVLVADGRRVLLGAADTFRAAAADQLETWAHRVGAEVVRGKEGADPAAVAFDAVKRGIEAKVDTVVVDTAGRLHTKTGLMDELSKVKRVVEKQAKVDEVLLVLDATTGQNGLTQARVFADLVDVTGIALTKLDGTAKGGIVFQVQRELGVPVKLVGLGEGPDDLAPFEPAAFVDALLG
ncbi:MAG TPA: signal recognition particle-docking protein FtsY [Pseudonocardiaceae bacterium]|nr:signal recognition particle-docking protein FtsY [Pseudonocardiaceae bacterium]